MKNSIKSMLAFTLSISLFAAGCKPGRENGKDISIEKYTGPYELATPTGTRVTSDEPDFPEEIVYWDPQRNLKPEYSPKEAAEKYAFIVNYTTLIYTSCEELQMRHSFRCVDYGSHLFVNSNGLICLDQSGEILFCNIWVTQTAHLEDADIPVFTHYAETLFDHLSPDDGTEPYIYDKIVNTPLPNGVRLSGFNELNEIITTSTGLKIRRDQDSDVIPVS